MPQYTIEDLFMAGFDSTFEKTASEEIDLSAMPVFAKLAANLGLLEEEEAPEAENTSDLEKLALSMASLKAKASGLKAGAGKGLSRAKELVTGKNVRANVKEKGGLKGYAKAMLKPKDEGEKTMRKELGKSTAAVGGTALAGGAALTAIMRKLFGKKRK